jgi:hypothetical protein
VKTIVLRPDEDMGPRSMEARMAEDDTGIVLMDIHNVEQA